MASSTSNNNNVSVTENPVFIAPRHNYFPFISCVATSVFIIFLLGSVITILARLNLHPHYTHLRVSNASIPHLMFSDDTIIAAECNVTLLITNTNRHNSAIYDSMTVSLFYPSQRVLLAQFNSNPFVQQEMNCTKIEVGFVSRDVYLGSDVVNALKNDVQGGSLRLGMRVEVMVSWKNVKFGARSHFMIAHCGDLVFGFSANREVGVFRDAGKECVVYLYN